MPSSTEKFLSQILTRDAPMPLNWQAPRASLPTTPLIAQQFKDNLLNNAQGSFNHFVESGQVWALLIGLLVGYMIHSMTSF